MISSLSAEVLRMERDELVHPTNKNVFHSARRGKHAPSPDVISTSHELFEGLSKRQLRRVRRHFAVVPVAEGALPGRQGDPCREFTVVLKGQVAIVLNGQPLAVIPPGCFFGAVALLYPDNPRRLGSSIALEPSVLAVANRQEFKQIMRDFPVVAGRITGVVEGRRQSLAEHLAAQADNTIEIETEFPIHALAST